MKKEKSEQNVSPPPLSSLQAKPKWTIFKREPTAIEAILDIHPWAVVQEVKVAKLAPNGGQEIDLFSSFKLPKMCAGPFPWLSWL